MCQTYTFDKSGPGKCEEKGQSLRLTLVILVGGKVGDVLYFISFSFRPERMAQRAKGMAQSAWGGARSAKSNVIGYWLLVNPYERAKRMAHRAESMGHGAWSTEQSESPRGGQTS